VFVLENNSWSVPRSILRYIRYNSHCGLDRKPWVCVWEREWLFSFIWWAYSFHTSKTLETPTVPFYRLITSTVLTF